MTTQEALFVNIYTKVISRVKNPRAKRTNFDKYARYAWAASEAALKHMAQAGKAEKTAGTV